MNENRRITSERARQLRTVARRRYLYVNSIDGQISVWDDFPDHEELKDLSGWVYSVPHDYVLKIPVEALNRHTHVFAYLEGQDDVELVWNGGD